MNREIIGLSHEVTSIGQSGQRMSFVYNKLQ